MQLIDEELPELSELLQPANTLRRSPRKREPHAPSIQLRTNFATSEQRQKSPRKTSPTKIKSKALTVREAQSQKFAQISLGDVPLLPRNDLPSTLAATSNNRVSPVRRNLTLSNVDALLLPLSKLVVEERDSESNTCRPASRAGSTHVLKKGDISMLSMMTEAARKPTVRKSPRKSQPRLKASSFILGEARCNDDEEDSQPEEEDEDTDLSGFIVDDNAELSNYGSGSESERDCKKNSRTKRPQGRLQRGSRWKQRVITDDEDSDKENDLASGIAKALKGLSIDGNAPKHKLSKHVEAIDLTVSPVKMHKSSKPITETNPSKARKDEIPRGEQPSAVRNLFNDFDKMLKISPTPEDSPQPPSDPFVEAHPSTTPPRTDRDGFKTPPPTPPRSPSKLKSPSKLLSPLKRNADTRSPHRQSMDGFWDHNIVNSWVDTYSPKKAPLGSPTKSPRKFQIWTDSDSDLDIASSSSTPTHSPSASPRKSSPMKSPEKAEKLRLANEKRLAKQAKADFEARKEQLALDLLAELDRSVTSSQISTLSSSTGGVQIIWSKTLRSTAGRANWRRTVTKLSGSPIKGSSTTSGVEVKVQHFASIELATKIIDCESRLVNTLAHEFCHLANFMISNVRDQPHGASFKAWAAKATAALRKSGNPAWEKVEVTTKHSYEINHKYLWVCSGRERSRAMAFLNVEEEEGCGAEYGRHSKSIDAERHRCGKCKGLLRQVRPTPRVGSPRKNERVGRSPVKNKEGSVGGLETMIEVVELSD